MKLKDACSLKKGYDKPCQHIKKQVHYFANKGPYSHSYDFFSSHVWMWELDHKEDRALKNWFFWTVVHSLNCGTLLRVPWTTRRSNQSILMEINPEYSLEGLMMKLKFQYFRPPDAKGQLITKDPDAGEKWRQEEKGTTENEMVGWHHRLNGHEFDQAPGDGEGHWGMACCSPWGRKELDTTEQLNNNKMNKFSRELYQPGLKETISNWKEF